MNRLSVLFVFGVVLQTTYAIGEIDILYSPDSVQLQKTTQTLKSSDYSKFIALCMGFSSEKPADWNGFYGYKHFNNIAKNVVTFNIPLSLGPLATQIYQYDTTDVDSQYSNIRSLLESRSEDSFTERVVLFNNNSLEKQLESLKSYLAKLNERKQENVGKDACSQNLAQIKESIDTIVNLFDNQVLVLSIYDVDQSHEPLNRVARQSAGENKKDIDRNLAYEFDANFHTAFATIGFTTIVLLITVFAVSVAMWNIDPGRDSIIYRLTSQKMKKDQ
ncbi:hypothetical protein RDWZM_002428 [Blomia tropicalis]|uniref:Renin receptor-like C-terminal transmembrane spanning segment domain-containing protein n=1 Tax=Blomia tropicalis TaxID=40697 RepID=A0A9Q0RPW9_BLOTA|nr:hypothetical protein RDWZM_002428 [Blomia tropicalis]